MSKPMELAGRWVLVTGASSGLGEAMARELAARQANLILVARRLDRLQALGHELQSEHGVRCHVIVADLANKADVLRVHAEAKAIAPVHALVLNAGVTHFGRHTDLDWEGFENLLATNVSSVVQLIHLFLPDMLSRNDGGGILLTSSMAGLLPVPFQSAYSGSKAFITHFGQGLAEELQGRNVSVMVYCPGGIDTAMTRNSGLNYFSNTPFLQDVSGCAAEGIQAMCSRKALYVPGQLNRLQLFATRFTPRALVNRITHATYRRALDRAG